MSAGGRAGEAEGAGKRSSSQATQIVSLALDAGVVAFRTPAGDPYVRVPVGERVEVHPLKSRAADLYLRRAFYEATGGKAAGGQGVADALNVLRSHALFDGEVESVHLRIAGCAGRIYLDLGRLDWGAIEIDGDGWRAISRPPVAFRRSRGMLPLPVPEPGGRLDDLRPFLNMGEADFRLAVTTLVTMVSPVGPYPVLIIGGEHVAAKSSTGRVVRRLIDPNMANLRDAPREARDLAIAAKNGHVLAFDNLSSMPAWLSDAICRLATGGGFATRELYADDEEVIFDAQRPVLINSIDEIAVRSDLLDRAVTINQPRIPDGSRRPEEEFWAAFEAAWPRLLGTVFDRFPSCYGNDPTFGY